MSKGKRKRIIIFGYSITTLVIIYAIFLAAYGMVLWGWIKGCDELHGEYKAIENGVIVEAELTDTWRVSTYDNRSVHYYHVMYEYVDGDIVYDGIAVYDQVYEEAEKYLGKKIKIYIDGKGHSIPVGRHPKIMTITLLTVFVVVLFVPAFFWPFIGDWISKWKEKRKIRKEEDKDLFFTRRKYD